VAALDDVLGAVVASDAAAAMSLRVVVTRYSSVGAVPVSLPELPDPLPLPPPCSSSGQS
jgi:hypothetical protein